MAWSLDSGDDDVTAVGVVEGWEEEVGVGSCWDVMLEWGGGGG